MPSTESRAARYSGCTSAARSRPPAMPPNGSRGSFAEQSTAPGRRGWCGHRDPGDVLQHEPAHAERVGEDGLVPTAAPRLRGDLDDGTRCAAAVEVDER